ncbi:class IV adenylate cyclase [Candidatus Nomurabacteria bacterium]|nr:class IV adenylate cyclase [Candidatus Nomurabacteria bacterium]
MEEIEIKFLDVNKEEIEGKLEKLGAKFIGVFDYRLKPYDFPNLSLAKEKNAWIRLRDEGKKITLAYKERLGVGENPLKDKGMKEIEVEVSDFDKTSEFLEAVGFSLKVYEERRRTQYILDGVECDIDEWPLIPPYIEFEGNSMEELRKISKKLGFSWNEHVITSALQILHHYSVDPHDYSIFTFEKQIKK